MPSYRDVKLEELAEKAGLDIDRIGRVVRQLIIYRIFEELKPRVISYSSTSVLI